MENFDLVNLHQTIKIQHISVIKMLLRSFSDVVVLTQNKLMTAGYIVHLYTKPSLFDERVL